MSHMAEHAGMIHPPKIETFDVAAGTNTDPKGSVREVEEYRVEPFGLYVARPTPGRAQFHYLESWLLPDLGLRLTDFWFTAGNERDQDFYLDIVTVDRDGATWRSTDWYLDIVVREGRGLEVLDTDELLAAAAAGLLSPADARRALEITYVTVTGLAAHGYKVRDWLSAMGIELAWRRH
jgi:predicted RNA-binding protein associated with RNAse of E/G family